MPPALAANAVAFSNIPEAAKVPFQRTSMERIRRKLRNVKVQQLAKRAHMAIGVQQPNPLAPRSESSC